MAETAAAKKAVSEVLSTKTEEQILTSVTKDVDDKNVAADKLDALMNKVDSITGTYDLAEYYCKQVVPAMSEIRAAADHCEIIIGKDYWPSAQLLRDAVLRLIEHTNLCLLHFLQQALFVFLPVLLWYTVCRMKFSSKEVSPCMISASSAAVLRD